MESVITAGTPRGEREGPRRDEGGEQLLESLLTLSAPETLPFGLRALFPHNVKGSRRRCRLSSVLVRRSPDGDG